MSKELKTFYVVGKIETPKPEKSALSKERARRHDVSSSTHIKYETVQEARESCQKKLRSMPNSGPWVVYQAIEMVDVPEPEIIVRKMHS